jgi:hypothetical protein
MYDISLDTWRIPIAPPLLRLEPSWCKFPPQTFSSEGHHSMFDQDCKILGQDSLKSATLAGAELPKDVTLQASTREDLTLHTSQDSHVRMT